MNLTRRILEGIHEVELEITPEFRKPAGKPSIWHMHDLMMDLGWKQEMSDKMVDIPGDPPGTVVSMMQCIWVHPDIPGLRMAARRHVSKKGDVMVADPTVDHALSWSAAWGGVPIEPLTLDEVGKVAKELVEKYGQALAKARIPTQVSSLEKALKAIGWELVASSGTGAEVYEHPSVRETIEVASDEDNIHHAELVFPDGKTEDIDPPTVENIVARAKVLESWA